MIRKCCLIIEKDINENTVNLSIDTLHIHVYFCHTDLNTYIWIYIFIYADLEDALPGNLHVVQPFHQEAIQLFRGAFAVNPSLQQVLQHVANAERAVAKQPGGGSGF